MIEATIIIAALIVSLIPLEFFRPLSVLINPAQGFASSNRNVFLNGLKISSKNVRGSAEVIWDRYGIPHIYATTDKAAIYALGWVEASQRLFQMDLIRRFVEGNLSALLGEEAVPHDKFINMLWLPEVIKNTTRFILNNSNFSDLVSFINVFVNGVNDYINYAEKHNLLPPEYKILGLKPEKWRFMDIVALEKFFSLMLSYDDYDLIVQELVNKWGPQILTLMDIVNRSSNMAVASCSESSRWGTVVNLNVKGSETENVTKAPNPEAIVKSFERSFKIIRLPGLNSLEGSNNWVVSGLFTKSGKPIVANDPHLSLTAPSLWMIVHISAPGLNVAGVLIPGSPFVVIGRNKHIAWGFTDLLGDFVDYYYYVWNGSKYYYKGMWLNVIKRNVNIFIWNPFKKTYKVMKLTIERTVNGPLLDVNGTRYAVSWTGLYPSNELEFIMKLNFACSVKEALSAQRYFGSPVQNFVVADDKGNFAWSPIGYYPIKTNLPLIRVYNVSVVNWGFLPFNGSKGEGKWSGFVKIKNLPLLYDPKIPFIATANTKPWEGNCGFYIGYHFADRFRLERIKELLYQDISRPQRVDVRSMMKVQLDIKDLSVIDYLHLLLQLVERGGYKLLNDSEMNIIKDLISWNGTMNTNLWKPTVALAWSYEFHKSLWKYLYGGASNVYSFRIEYAESLIKNYLNGFNSIYKIVPKGFLEKLAAQSFKNSLAKLSSYFGTDDYHKWVYGKIHYYEPAHPLGSLFSGFNYPSEEAPGGPYTINVAVPSNFSKTEGFPVTLAPSVRLISDLGNHVLYISLPGGTSGDPFSKYYHNLYMLWVKGMYFTIDLDSGANNIEAIAKFYINRG